MEEKNSEIEQLKKEFQFTLSKVSHEIRNPVTLINSFMQLLVKEHPEIEDYPYWNEIEENMEFLKLLLNELSSYNNASLLHPEFVNVWEFLEDVAGSLRPTLQYLGTELLLENHCAPVTLSLDLTKMRAVLFNLLRNASEAIGTDGHILLRLSEKDSLLILEIIDDGGGIPEEFLPTLFDPFVTHKPEGTGLGLAIARQVVEAHGGNIKVTTLYGKGTTFTLSFPVIT